MDRKELAKGMDKKELAAAATEGPGPNFANRNRIANLPPKKHTTSPLTNPQRTNKPLRFSDPSIQQIKMVKASIAVLTVSVFAAPALAAVAADWQTYQARGLAPESIEADLAARDLGSIEDQQLSARGFFDEEEQLSARDFLDEEQQLSARDFDDTDLLSARGFSEDEMEALSARDFIHEEDLFARGFDEDEILYARGGGKAKAAKAFVNFVRHHHKKGEKVADAVTSGGQGTDNERREFIDDAESVYAREFFDEEQQLSARDFDDSESLYAREFDDSEGLYAHEFFDEEQQLLARDFGDEESLSARDFIDEEQLSARDFVDEEDLYARDFADDEALFTREFDDEYGLYARSFDGGSYYDDLD